MGATDRELIAKLQAALEHHVEQTRPIQSSTTAIAAAREHLAKPAAARVTLTPAQQHADELVEALRPFAKYGRPGSRDVEVGKAIAVLAKIDAADQEGGAA